MRLDRAVGVFRGIDIVAYVWPASGIKWGQILELSVADQGRWSQLTLETRTFRRRDSRHSAERYLRQRGATTRDSTRRNRADSVPSADLFHVRDSGLVDRRSGEHQRCAETHSVVLCHAAVSLLSRTHFRVGAKRRDARGECVPFETFQRQVFPGNWLHLYWQPNITTRENT